VTAKIQVDKRGAIDETDEWRIGLNITRANVIDLIEVAKPRNAITSNSIVGNKDKARSKLVARMRELRGQQ